MTLHGVAVVTRSRSLGSLTRLCAALMLALYCAALLAHDAQALNLKLKGVNYDFRQGPDYDSNRCKAASSISRELKFLSTVTPRVRIYALSDCNVRPVLKYAKQNNLTVWMGVWVGNTTKIFDKELKALKVLVQEGAIERGQVVGINVGSESLYRNETTAEELIANMKSVKEVLAANNLSDIPVSITDTLGELLKNPSVLEAVDVVSFNSFPFWGKVPIEDAAKNLNESVAALRQVTGNKSFVITETGWPYNGFSREASSASTESAAKYLHDFFLLAETQRWSYYYFSGFDTPYRKQVENDANTVEAYFGLFGSTSKLNKAYDKLVINGTTGADGPVTELPKSTSASTPAPSPSHAATLSRSLASTALTLTVGMLLVVGAL